MNRNSVTNLLVSGSTSLVIDFVSCLNNAVQKSIRRAGRSRKKHVREHNVSTLDANGWTYIHANIYQRDSVCSTLLLPKLSSNYCNQEQDDHSTGLSGEAVLFKIFVKFKTQMFLALWRLYYRNYH